MQCSRADHRAALVDPSSNLGADDGEGGQVLVAHLITSHALVPLSLRISKLGDRLSAVSRGDQLKGHFNPMIQSTASSE